jgi:hypothetical protein
MSTALFFLIPIGMLAVVWSVCFVGCHFPTSGLPYPPYSDFILNDSNTTPSLLAYWTLSDLLFPTTLNAVGQTEVANDLSSNNHNGTYTIPPDYPVSQFSDPIANSSLTRDTSIVNGDANSTKNTLPASVNFKGGYVSIPWNTPNSTPADLTDFTFEAWIQPNLPATNFHWVVFSAFTNDHTGFAVLIDENNNWNVFFGNGTANPMLNPGAVAAIIPGSTTYVAVTYSSSTNTLALWINPDSDDNSAPLPIASNTSANYAAPDQSTPMTLFIGTGDNNDAQTLRTQANGPGAPLLPFVGLIQSVALYSTALQPTDLAAHFAAGAASP